MILHGSSAAMKENCGIVNCPLLPLHYAVVRSRSNFCVTGPGQTAALDLTPYFKWTCSRHSEYAEHANIYL